MRISKLYDGLYFVEELFEQDFLNKIIKDLDKQTQWEKVENQEYLNRQALKWADSELLDEIYSYLDQIDFSTVGFKLRTLTIWLDSAGYTIKQHIDNDRVVGSMQIYLSPNISSSLGTWFNNIEIPYKQNTGYIMDNKYKISHGMKDVVPEGVNRYSLYVYFDYVNSI